MNYIKKFSCNNSSKDSYWGCKRSNLTTYNIFFSKKNFRTFEKKRDEEQFEEEIQDSF